MTTMQKPGWKTSEFWLAAFNQLLPVLVFLGIVPAADAQSLVAMWAQIVAGAVASVSFVAYVIQRYQIKAMQPIPASPPPMMFRSPPIDSDSDE